MKELIEYIARSLVDNADAVRVDEIDTPGALVYELHVAPEDMGRVIGKSGRVANAIRVLLRASVNRTGKRTLLEIV
ncbi:MAG: KH domain-containing protein [Chloroflexi bacterium]|nr:KH domain-containing protein [Chloroflexota bacterium]